MEAKEKEILNLKDQMNKMTSQQRNIMAFFKITKEKLQSLELKSSELMNENQKLKIRAASAWEELTPRPDLFTIIQILGFDTAIYNSFGSKQLANEIIELINKLRLNKNINSKSLSPGSQRRGSQLVPEKRPLKRYLDNKSTHSRDKSENSISPESEEFKRYEFLMKKNNILPIVNEMVNKEINQEDMMNRKSVIAHKRLYLLGLEKNDDGNKRKSWTPQKN